MQTGAKDWRGGKRWVWIVHRSPRKDRWYIKRWVFHAGRCGPPPSKQVLRGSGCAPTARQHLHSSPSLAKLAAVTPDLGENTCRMTPGAWCPSCQTSYFSCLVKGFLKGRSVGTAWRFTLPAQQGPHTETPYRQRPRQGSKRISASPSASTVPIMQVLPTPHTNTKAADRHHNKSRFLSSPAAFIVIKQNPSSRCFAARVLWCSSGCGPFLPKVALENESRLLGFASCFLLASLPDSLTSAGCCSFLHSGAIRYETFLTISDDFGVGEGENPPAFKCWAFS